MEQLTHATTHDERNRSGDRQQQGPEAADDVDDKTTALGSSWAPPSRSCSRPEVVPVANQPSAIRR